jgi:ATP-dependent helicase HrpA
MAPHGSVRAVLEDAEAAAVDALMAEAGGPAWDEAGFTRLRSHVAGRVETVTREAVAQVVKILSAERDVVRRMEDMTARELEPARRDVERQLRRLVYPGFILGVGVPRLADVERYLRGAALRLERLPSGVSGDLDRMRAIHEVEVEVEQRIAAWPSGQPLPEPLREVPWLLEELRISHFAQGLGVRGQVSTKRVRKLLEAA